VVLCALLGACGQDEVLSLSRFDLHVPGHAQAIPIEIPRHLHPILPARDSEYELHTVTSVPESFRGRTLTLAIPHLFAHAQLFVAGGEMFEIDPDPAEWHRSLGTLRFRIPAEVSAREQLDLVVRVHHTWTQSAWLDTPMRLSATTRGDAFSAFVATFNRQGAWFGLASVFVTCFTSLLVFLLDRRQIAFAWFALESGLGCTMPMFQMGAATVMFGVYDTVLMGAGISIALWASVYFTHAQFGLGRPHRIHDVLLIFTLLLIASAPGPFVLTQRAGGTVIAFISLNVVYQIFLTMRLWMRGVRSVHALVLTASWAALGLAASGDQLAWAGLGELLGGVRAGPLGVTAIGLLQAAVMSHDYITTLKRTDVLNLELADRVRLLESKDLENTALNEVLRRQIAARSEQLAHAIVRIGKARTKAAPDLAVGSVVEGRYRVMAVLGRGGMGTVYEVVRLIDERPFALKVLSGRGGAVEMARFAREAQLVAQLQHPRVVSIVDVDVASDGLLFIVLELVRGKTMREHMDRGRDEPAFALRMLQQIAEGLAAIHEQGIVHRDLKPDNILVVEEANTGVLSVKVTDFGVSAVAGAKEGARRVSEPSSLPIPHLSDLTVPLHGENHVISMEREQNPQGADRGPLTEAGMLIGTPRYMAPEAIEGATPAVDVFAFGVMAYELLAGRTPFLEPLVMLKLAGRPMMGPAPLGIFAPDLHPALASLFERCLSEDPALRPTAAAIVEALQARDSPAHAKAG